MKNMKKLAMLILAGMTIGATTVQAEETSGTDDKVFTDAPKVNMDIRFFGQKTEGKKPDDFIKKPFVDGKGITIKIEQVSEANSMTGGEKDYLAPNETKPGVFSDLVGFGDGWTNNKTTNTKTIIINNKSTWDTVIGKADHTAGSGTYIENDDLLWRSSVSPLQVESDKAKAGIYVFKVSQELPSFNYHTTDGKVLSPYAHVDVENGVERERFNWGAPKYYHVYVKNNGEVTYTVTTDINDKNKIYKIPSDDVRFVNTYFSKSEPLDITVTGENDNFAEYTLKIELTNAILAKNKGKGMADQDIHGEIEGYIQRGGSESELKAIDINFVEECYVDGLITGDKVIFEGLPAGTQVKVTEDRVMNAIKAIEWQVIENGQEIATGINPEAKIATQSVILGEKINNESETNSITIKNIFGEISITGILTGRNPMTLVMIIIAGAVFFYIFMKRREDQREAE